jgi:hypothetical protein
VIIIPKRQNLASNITFRNSNCIDLRDKGPNIYMYRKEKIYKESIGEIQ